jgi:hypothetical protein
MQYANMQYATRGTGRSWRGRFREMAALQAIQDRLSIYHKAEARQFKAVSLSVFSRTIYGKGKVDNWKMMLR